MVQCNNCPLHVIHRAFYRTGMESSKLVSANSFVPQNHDADNLADVMAETLDDRGVIKCA